MRIPDFSVPLPPRPAAMMRIEPASALQAARAAYCDRVAELSLLAERIASGDLSEISPRDILATCGDFDHAKLQFEMALGRVLGCEHDRLVDPYDRQGAFLEALDGRRAPAKELAARAAGGRR